MKIIPDSRIRNMVSKGPKYRFPSRIDSNRCRNIMASALNDFRYRRCQRESVECNALKEWKLSIFNILDKRIKTYIISLVYGCVTWFVQDLVRNPRPLLPPWPRSSIMVSKNSIESIFETVQSGPYSSFECFLCS